MTHLNSLVHVEPQVFFSESSVAQTLSDTKLLLGSVWSSDFTDTTLRLCCTPCMAKMYHMRFKWVVLLSNKDSRDEL